MKAPLRVVFMGTPDFAVPCLKALLARPDVATVLAVYTQPDRPAGRGLGMKASAVKQAALEAGLPVFQPENVNAAGEPRRLADFMADVFVVVAYAQFLGKAVLNTPRLGCVNVHGSLLPRHRGAAPIQYSLLAGDPEAGITTMRLVMKMDAGPMLLRRAVPINDEMTAGDLHDGLSKVGATLLVETLEGLRDGALKEEEQNESLATYAPAIEKSQGRLDFAKPCRQLLNQWQAFTPWPGVFRETDRGILKVLKARLAPDGADPADAPPGTIQARDGRFLVKCGDGWLEFLVVQLEGKKPLPAGQFLHGIQGSKEPFRFL